MRVRMQTFRDQEASFSAREIAGQRDGKLQVFCEVRVKGNHLKGPVPVEINYQYIFSYATIWRTQDGLEVTQSRRSFDTARERNMYVSEHFSVEDEWNTYENRYG